MDSNRFGSSRCGGVIAGAALVVAGWSSPALGVEPASASSPALADIDEAEAAAEHDAAQDAKGGWSLIPFVLPAYQPETSFLLGGAAYALRGEILAVLPAEWRDFLHIDALRELFRQ